MYVPPLGDQVPTLRNRQTRRLATAVLRLFGWRFEGTIPNLAKFVVIFAPHTTGWDFVVGMVAIQSLGIRVSWLGVDWLFRIPFIRSLGGIPVDRSRPQGLVAQSIQHFKDREHLVLAISPEGSRKKVRWKKGFYHIAVGAGVPIMPILLDQQKKLILFADPLEPVGDFEADMDRLRSIYEELLERYPDHSEMRW